MCNGIITLSNVDAQNCVDTSSVGFLTACRVMLNYADPQHMDGNNHDKIPAGFNHSHVI